MLNDGNEDSASGKAARSVILILSGCAVAFVLADLYLTPWIEARDYEREIQTRADPWGTALEAYGRCLLGGSPEPPLTVPKFIKAAANAPQFLDQTKVCRSRLQKEMGEPPPPAEGELKPLVESLFGAVESLPPKNLYTRHELSNAFFEDLCRGLSEASTKAAEIRSRLKGSPAPKIASSCNTVFEDAAPLVPEDLPDTVAASTPSAWRLSSDGGRLELQYNSKLIDRSYWAHTRNGRSWEIVIGPPNTPFVPAFDRDGDTLWSISRQRVLRHTPRGWSEDFEIDEGLEPAGIHHAAGENTTSVIAWGPGGEQIVLRFEQGREKATRSITFQEADDASLLSAAFSPTGDVFGVSIPSGTSEKVRIAMSRLKLHGDRPQRSAVEIETQAPASAISPAWCFAQERGWLILGAMMLTRGTESEKESWSVVPSLPEGFDPQFAACRDDGIALLGKMDIERMPRRDVVSLCSERGCDPPFQVSPFPASRAGLLWDHRGLELVLDDGQRWYRFVRADDTSTFEVESIKTSVEGPLDHLVARHGPSFYSLVSSDNLQRGGQPYAVTSFPQTKVVSRIPP